MKTCDDLMSIDLKCIGTGATALDAARMMRDTSLGFLPVCDPETARVVGVVTDRDLVTRMCAIDGCPSETPVASVSTPRPAVCHPDDDVRIAERIMTSLDISRI